MRNMLPNAVQQEIDAARRLLKPTPVRLHHVPRWFGLCLKPFRARYRSALAAIDEMRLQLDAYWGVGPRGAVFTVRSHGEAPLPQKPARRGAARQPAPAVGVSYLVIARGAPPIRPRC
jgi:hypothetical protein